MGGEYGFRIEIAKAVGRTEVEIAFAVFPDAACHETGKRYVIFMVIVVEFAFFWFETDDIIVGAEPDVSWVVFCNGAYVGIVESVCPLVYLVFGRRIGRKTD